MPPTVDDPYATPRAKFFDLLLCLITIVLIVLVILTSPRHRSTKSERQDASRAGELASQ